ncbi:hypothetical protein BSK48_05270 [Paenibacillus odorifer]|uniref:restriction endonuclease subunit S n=1 Tax=Paenibacillus odorifer TaxID=189426 RepID=UPI00096D92EB|nr:restriction endonuclease subunit S [Paenibacillus odorifer]OMD73281.1 hypothetical protein BSK48_05270 [Paenibacillus odorifer]
MNAQDLKNSILQLAIQGKLVEQRKEEGTARELLKKIKTEREQLIKEKKIKKENSLPAITEDEILFDIPESWEWTRLGQLTSIFGRIGYRGYTKEDMVDKGQGSITISPSNLTISGKTNFVNCSYISWEKYQESPEIMTYNGDIILVKTGSSYGKCAIVENLPEKATINPQLVILKYLLCNVEFLDYSLRSSIAKNQYEKFVIGTSIPTFSQEKLKNLILPLPPLEEQKRIVTKIEELMPYVEKYDEAHSKLEAFNKKFPKDMQKSILQYAIQGKLVEQRDEEGTAEALYQQIQEEKEKLIKEGKLKKEKPLPAITAEEIPFDIPDSWKWVRLGNLFNISTGMTPSKTNPLFHEKGDIPWITSSQTGELRIKKANNFITRLAIESTSLKIYPKHTLLIAMYGQGKTRGQVSELLIDAAINQACAALENVSNNINIRNYILFFQMYNYDISRTGAEGSAQPNLNLDKIRNILVPLPPLKEQNRIVAKIEELMPFCQQLVK